jgi:3-phosphoshikimate 1-carboxyvinyltransferase
MTQVQPTPDYEARSPWSRHNGKRSVAISPAAETFNQTIRLSGSKSLTNRALIIAALATGTSRIEGLLLSDDSYWCIESLRSLGIKVNLTGTTAEVQGCGGLWPIRSGTLYAGAAGTIARFLPGALAVGSGEWTVTGSRRLSERPLGPLLAALEQLGAQFAYGERERCLPFTLQANGLQGGAVTLPGSASSQFISGLLLAAPYAKAPIAVQIEGEVVQREYVNMTLALMKTFGIAAEVADKGSTINVPIGEYKAGKLELEPDVSACCYFWALAALTGSRITIVGIDAAATSQPDIEMAAALERMGCRVERGNSAVTVQGTGILKGDMTISMQSWSDQTLTLAVLAIFADGPITLTDAGHIRQHECDRISAICQELRKLGIRVDEHEDGLTVYPGAPQPALLDSHDDHRMAMALALVGSRTAGIRIADPGCVSKTCPDYFARLSALGIGIEFD